MRDKSNVHLHYGCGLHRGLRKRPQSSWGAPQALPYHPERVVAYNRFLKRPGRHCRSPEGRALGRALAGLPSSTGASKLVLNLRSA
jgi:hypothetical protein